MFIMALKIGLLLFVIAFGCVYTQEIRLHIHFKKYASKKLLKDSTDGKLDKAFLLLFWASVLIWYHTLVIFVYENWDKVF